MSLLTRSIALALIATPVASAQSWNSSHPDMPGWAHEYTVSVAEQAGENQVFVLGGLNGLSALDSVWRFHRVSGWTALSNMPGQRAGADSATVEIGGNDRIYLFGGRFGLTGATSTNWSYDPATDSWDSATPTPMPTARRGHEAVTAPDGKIYVFGGRNASGSVTYATLEIYDPVLNSWTTGPNMPRARYDFAALTDCDGFIYLYGGEVGATIHGEIDCFDTNTGTWTATNPHVGGVFPDMPTPRVSLAGALGRNGRHYLMGGNVFGPVPVADVESYDPYTNAWSFESSMLQSRNSFEAAGMGSRVWVMGGYRKIHPTTRKVESFGGLSTFGPCGGVVPPLPPLFLSAAASIATPLTSTGGIIDHVTLPFESAWVEIQLPAGTDGVIDPQPIDETQHFEMYVHDAMGNLIAESFDNSALLLRDQSGVGGQMTRFFVELRNTTQSEIEFSLFASDSIELQPIGETYCGPAVPNSTGDPSGITAEGFTLASANELRLSVDGLPANSYGYFLVSRDTGQIAHPGGSSGTLCLTGTIGRFAGNVLNSGANGTVALDVDLMNLPGNPPTSVQPGDTWNFTYWHRDAGPIGVTSNFSDAVRVTFE